MFLSVGSSDTGKWCLKDWTIEGCDPTSDSLQVLNPASAATEYSITYIDADWAVMLFGEGCEGLAGWYKTTLDECMDNFEFAAEQGFLASFFNDIKITFSGVVNPAEKPIVDSKGTKYPMIANFLPRQVQWKELEPTGFDPTSDSLQVLNPKNAATEYSVTYIDADWASIVLSDANLKGWWTTSLEQQMDEEYIEPGEAFLASFFNTITIRFPQAIKK